MTEMSPHPAPRKQNSSVFTHLLGEELCGGFFLNVSTARLANLFAQILKLYPHIHKGNSHGDGVYFIFPCALSI